MEIIMQTLKFSTDSFDQDNTFTIECKGFKRMKNIRASLHIGYQKDGDGIIWAMQKSSCLKDQYTAKDMEESARLNSMTPLRNGDSVMIEGKEYTIRVKGDYSDCAIFDLVK